MKYTLGKKGMFGTFHPDTVYDEHGRAICLVYGIASNAMLEDLDERDAEGLAIGRKIVEALNALNAKEQEQR